MTAELNRATRWMLFAFAAILVSIAYWAVIEADNLTARDNARNATVGSGSGAALSRPRR